MTRGVAVDAIAGHTGQMCAEILVAEDDTRQAELIRRYLAHEGHRVAVVHDGKAALDLTARQQFDLIMLDVMMPQVNGLNVCRTLRASSDVPIVLLTARSLEDDVIVGFDLGADDYITKPYRPREMVARVRTLLRRSTDTKRRTDAVIEIGDLTIDPVRHQVSRGAVPIECTPAEFRLLATLAAEPYRVFTRQQLLEKVHGIDGFITERTVDVHIMKLRRKVEIDPGQPQQILTVYGIGYKMVDHTRGEQPNWSTLHNSGNQ